MSHSTDQYNTGPEIAALVAVYFGGECDLDPASNKYSMILSRDRWNEGALDRKWDADSIYLNPPYGDPKPFVQKLVDSMAESISLVKLDNSTEWWEILTDECTGICLLRKRPVFWYMGYPEPGVGKFSSAIVCREGDYGRFEWAFSSIGTCWKKTQPRSLFRLEGSSTHSVAL